MNHSGDNTLVVDGLVPTWRQGIYNHLLGSSQMYISVIPKLFSVYMPRSLRHTMSWWRHQMENFFALLAICAGNSPVPGEFPTQKPVTRSFDVFFDLRPINGWVNNGEAGDLRRHRAHYDVSVVCINPPACHIISGNQHVALTYGKKQIITWHCWLHIFSRNRGLPMTQADLFRLYIFY